MPIPHSSNALLIVFGVPQIASPKDDDIQSSRTRKHKTAQHTGVSHSQCGDCEAMQGRPAPSETANYRTSSESQFEFVSTPSRGSQILPWHILSSLCGNPHSTDHVLYPVYSPLLTTSIENPAHTRFFENLPKNTLPAVVFTTVVLEPAEKNPHCCRV